MEPLTILIILVVGLFAGFINVIIGSGSSIGVPLLISIGIPPVTAIGTNRFAMIFNGISGVHGYHIKKKLNWKTAIYFSIFAGFGAIIGALLVLDSKPEILKQIIALILILEGIFILFMKKDTGVIEIAKNISGVKKYFYWGIFGFVLGLYGGFIGMAMTSMVIFFLVSIFGYKFIESAAISKVIVLTISILASVIFLANLKVNFLVGVTLAISYIIGAYLGVHSAIKIGNKNIKYLFIIVIFLLAIKLLVL